MPTYRIYEFICEKPGCERSGGSFEAMVEPEEAAACPSCKDSEWVKRAINAHAGYSISGANGASQRPKNAGSFKRGSHE